MITPPEGWAPYADIRRVELSFSFGVVAPDAAATAVPAASQQVPVSVLAQTTDEVEQMGGKYTTLERNMFVLDGTMQMYGGDNGQVGYQSAAVSGDDKTYVEAPWIEFSFSKNQSSYGFTLIFDDTQPDNYPGQVMTTTYDLNNSQIGALTTRPDSFFHIVNLPTQNYRRVRFTFLSTNLPHRRVRLCSVRFGIRYDYDPDSISSVTVRQSVSPWSQNLPSTEIEATSDNSSHLYNMINPDGMYRYLQDGQYMEWTLHMDGRKVEMGRGYFTSAKSQDGGLTASITFHDRLYVMDDIEFTGGSSGTWKLSEAIATLLTTSGTGITATFEGNLGDVVIGRDIPQKSKIREAIRLCAQAAMCTCMMDRNNQLHFYTPHVADGAADRWTRDIQHEDAQVLVGQLYNVVQLTVSETVYTAKNVAVDDFERIYEVSNPLVVSGDAVAQWILGWVQRRVSYEVTTRGNPVLDLLDTVQIDDIYGVNGRAMLTQLDYIYDGGLQCDAAAIR